MQNFTSVLVQTPEVPVCLVIQQGQVPLDGSPALEHTNSFPTMPKASSSNLTRVYFMSFRSLIKMFNVTSHNIDSCSVLLEASTQVKQMLPLRVILKPVVFYSSNCPYILTAVPSMGSSQSPAKGRVNCVYCSLLPSNLLILSYKAI